MLYFAIRFKSITFARKFVIIIYGKKKMALQTR